MPLRRKVSPTPAELLDVVRAAQDQHAADVHAANQRLVDTHSSVYAQAKDRQETIAEQITLLSAEHDQLANVAVKANPANATVR